MIFKGGEMASRQGDLKFDVSWTTLDAALAQFGFSWADLQADVVKSLEQ